MDIGITSKFSHSFLANGLNQNIVLLYEALELCGHNPFFIDFTGKEGALPHDFITSKKLITWEDYKKNHETKVDIVLCPGISANKCIQTATLEKNTKAKIAAIHYGNNLLSDIQSMFFAEEKSYYGINPEPIIDHILYSPHYKIAKQYYEATEYAPASEIPYIWDPKFIEYDAKARSLELGYKHCSRPNIAVVEPNLNISKTSFAPILTIIKLLEESPEIFNTAAIFANAFHEDGMEKVKYWLANKTAIKHNPRRVFFDPRKALSSILADDNPIILSHQFYNELNYVYLEAMHYGHPLVHNSEPFKEYGYFYEEYNIIDAKNCLINAAQNFNKESDQHKSAADKLIKQYSVGANLEAINCMIERIIND